MQGRDAFLLLGIFALVFLSLFAVEDDAGQIHDEATHLLDEAREAVEFFELEQQRWIRSTLDEIGELSDTLRRHTEEMRRLTAEQSRKKQGRFFWMLDSNTRLSVEELQLQINDVRRLAENTAEDIAVHWKRLKPLFGIRSKMFVSEAGVSILNVLVESLTFWLPSLTFSLFSVLLIGPVALLFFWAWMAVGTLLLPYFMAVLAVIWATRFPVVICQYDPSLGEFAVVYLAGVGLVASMVYFVHWLTAPKQRTIKIKRH